ncbi:molybdate ABC transporter substrate-binding protein [Mobilicoccus pelagius]|uniref:Molybdate ABC transporter-substrate binding protein n=1 Tax=Mobilicoccus pelagius NBRC 104925 TaxID=1089455 RepID=H5URE5_9MICO|nr:molybdate ABC transporter substrate-binding protein [Mobilicoccus pelagius]GAB48303.1 molybdate ABC transporter-substrate binding protein [Mobilicoccus pelagius NBRC 104925]
MTTTRTRLFALAGALTLALSACGGNDAPVPADKAAASPSGGSGSYAPITVFAAASLHTVFDEIGADVEKQTGAKITFSYAGSSDLAAQLNSGALGDVFASANEKQMTVAVSGGSVAKDAPTPFATNTLTIVTPKGNPAHVTALADLRKPEVKTVVCAPQVPCGAATGELFTEAGLTVTPVSEESAVTDVLGKVTSGQADAGLVYVTDATGAGDDVTVVKTPEAAKIVNVYPIAITAHGVEDAGRQATAEAFVEAVRSTEGQQLLSRAGFGAPTS